MRLLHFVAPATLALAFTAPALADGDMILSGTGVVRAAPDMATVSTGVVTQALTAREALDANTAAMDELLAVLREAGLESRDIQTSDFNVSPQHVYSDQRDENGYTLPPEIAGYQVSNTVTISVRALDNLGSVLDQVVSVGANTIHGISFSVENPTELLEEARRRAFTDAHAKAQTYADVAGVRLGGIETISEQQNVSIPQPQLRAAYAEAASADAVPVEAGELTYSVTTTVTWSIDD